MNVSSWPHARYICFTKRRIKPCCGFESSCNHVNFRFRTASSKKFLDINETIRVWIHSETHMWHSKNIQSNALYRWVLITQLNHLASLAKCLCACLWTKWSWIPVQLQWLIEKSLFGKKLLDAWQGSEYSSETSLKLLLD